MPLKSDSSDKKPVISFRVALIVATVFILINIFISVLLSNQQEQRTIIIDIYNEIIQLLATFGLFYGAYHSKDYGKRIQMAWIVLSLAQLFFAIGDLGFAYYDIFQGGGAPYPSLADPPSLIFYFLFASGLLILPRLPLTSSERTKMLLDMGIVIVAATLIYWVLLIVPTIESGAEESTLTMAVSVAYNVGDLVLLFALIELLFRRMRSIALTPMLLLLASAATLIITDFIYFVQTFQDTYISGGLLDTGWIVAYALNGLAGISQANARGIYTTSKDSEPQIVQFSWPVYLPYISAAAAYILLMWSHDHPLPVRFDYLSWGVGGIIALIIIRQVVALKENAMLYEASAKEVVERKKAEENVRKLNEELENRVIERTAQLQAANKELRNEIFEREKAQEELRKARDGLEIRVRERTEELQSKNSEMERFIYTVSHDLRSPLVTIQGFQGFLMKDIEKDDKEKVKADLKTIGNAVTKMDHLLSETLELSRIGRVANPPEDVSFEEIVKESQLQISERIRTSGIEVVVANNMPSVHVDRMRIVEVMINLIENSIKYIGNPTHPKVEIGYIADANDPAFFVRDNGIGIDPSQHSKIFELFYKVNKSSEGTGAGLAIVKRIIEVHGGHIWAESEPGKGTTVYFTLPLAESEKK